MELFGKCQGQWGWERSEEEKTGMGGGGGEGIGVYEKNYIKVHYTIMTSQPAKNDNRFWKLKCNNREKQLSFQNFAEKTLAFLRELLKSFRISDIKNIFFFSRFCKNAEISPGFVLLLYVHKCIELKWQESISYRYFLDWQIFSNCVKVSVATRRLRSTLSSSQNTYGQKELNAAVWIK